MSMAIDAGAWINHYWHKSAQEFIWRRSNSTGDQVVASGSIVQEALAQRFMEDFGQRWVRDDRVRSHKGPEEEAARLRNLPGVRFAEMQSRDLFCAMSLDKVRQNLRSGGPEARKLAELVTHAFDRPI